MNNFVRQMAEPNYQIMNGFLSPFKVSLQNNEQRLDFINFRFISYKSYRQIVMPHFQLN